MSVRESDTDFGGLLAAQRAGSPSVVLTREIATLHTSELGPLLVAALEVAANRFVMVRSQRSGHKMFVSADSRCVDRVLRG